MLKQENDICFTTEAFCGLFAETTLDAANVVEYIERAVTFANEHLWGSLNATIIVHPRSLQEPAVAAALERAIANLHYGTIGINYWGGVGFTLGVTTWGAFPGDSVNDVRSGIGIVHNTLMFDQGPEVGIAWTISQYPDAPLVCFKGKKWQ